MPPSKRKKSTAAVKRGKQAKRTRRRKAKEALAEIDGDAWEEVFFEALRERRNYALACRLAGKGRKTVKQRQQDDPLFDARVREVWDTVVDDLEASMMGRAIDGYDEPVYYKGKKCGTRTVHHPVVGIFMLKKNRPGKYDDRVPGQGDVEPITQQDVLEATQAMIDSVPSKPQAGQGENE